MSSNASNLNNIHFGTSGNTKFSEPVVKRLETLNINSDVVVDMAYDRFTELYKNYAKTLEKGFARDIAMTEIFFHGEKSGDLLDKFQKRVFKAK